MQDKQLMQERLERLAIVLDNMMPECARLVRDTVQLVKKQEEDKNRWIKHITNTQLMNKPGEWQNEDQKMYSLGVYDGLQIALDIMMEEH